MIVAVGVFFAGMGLYALAAPALLLRPFGLVPGEATARAEVRAVYGGFGLAMAAILGYAAVTPGQLRTGIIITVAAALAGMALGRIISGLIDGPTSFYPNWFYCLVEAAAAGGMISVA
ncbi:DUF4345 family protein [Mycobacterium dioxanotrophicus]|jgi:hypothetical protein|nr:DUF4345 family protein [Mycobacterium dioxanotrophicus]